MKYSKQTCTNPCQCLNNHPLVFKRTAWCFQDVQKYFFEEHLKNKIQYCKKRLVMWSKYCTDVNNQYIQINLFFMKNNQLTSICIFKCCLKLDKRVRKMASESSNTSGTELTPFLDRATHKYCLMAFINISLVLKTGPAFCRMDNRSCRDRTLDRSSCDLKEQWRKKFSKMTFLWYTYMYMCINALWIWI